METFRQVMGAMRLLREKLTEEVFAWENGGTIQGTTIDQLNQLLAKPRCAPKLLASKKASLGTQLYFETRKPGDLFAPLVIMQRPLFSSVDASRLRKCDQSAQM
jgi:hypothetical protein